MYKHVEKLCRSCGECTTVTGVGTQNKPPLHPTPVLHSHLLVGIDIIELPKTEQGT